MRSSAVMTRSWSFGLAEEAVATALAMSMSKPGDLRGERVAGAEEVGVGRDPDDEVAALDDLVARARR